MMKKENKLAKHLPKFLTVIAGFPDGVMQSEVGRILDMSKQRIHNYSKQAQSMAFIEAKKVGKERLLTITPVGMKAIKLHRKGKFDTAMRALPSGKINVHSYIVLIHLSENNAKSRSFRKYWRAKTEGRNTRAHYLKKGLISDATLKITGNKLFIYFHSFYLDECDPFVPSLGLYTAQKFIEIKELLLRKFKISIDLNLAECIDQHIAIRMPELAEFIGLQRPLKMYLGRKARSLAGTMRREAYATIDGTPRPGPNVECNDVSFAQKFLMMPERVGWMTKELVPLYATNIEVMREFSAQIKTHLGAINKMDRNMRRLTDVVERHDATIRRFENRQDIAESQA